MNLFTKSDDKTPVAGSAAPEQVVAPIDTTITSTEKNPQEKTELGKLTAFVKEDPQNTYYIDGEREVARSSVCRNTQQGRTCLQLLISSKVMFQQMQKMNFYCALTDEIGRTDMECKYVP
ncbi:hypothetical protein CJU90_6673 [Yarrowia sp. C11]|nr:hypothetical protein CJU90_6673 [Yarrowia sp. C11]KAG5358769.1 hypothetical protein CKK34_5050 [Yarrowia sp. E02]